MGGRRSPRQKTVLHYTWERHSPELSLSESQENVMCSYKEPAEYPY